MLTQSVLLLLLNISSLCRIKDVTNIGIIYIYIYPEYDSPLYIFGMFCHVCDCLSHVESFVVHLWYSFNICLLHAMFLIHVAISFYTRHCARRIATRPALLTSLRLRLAGEHPVQSYWLVVYSFADTWSLLITHRFGAITKEWAGQYKYSIW